jgi:hypothetical protein
VLKIVWSAELQVRKVGAGPMGGGLVEAEAVARQGRPCAKWHPVPAAGAGEAQGVGVGLGRY